MSRRTLVRYAVVPLLAVVVFWYGGYLYFRGSSDWQEIQTLLTVDPAIQMAVGEVRGVSLAPLPFMYRFSGDYAKATLRVTVVGTKGEYQSTVEAERRAGRWVLLPP